VNTEYNGWTNYATWRVHLEIFDGATASDYGTWEPSDLVADLKDYVEQAIVLTSEAGIARDYAMAFISDVNWYEIADHLIDAAKEAEGL
jgi:hypothetical protein